MVALPNTLVAKGKVTSYTNFPKLRLDIDVTVGVNESIANVRELLLEVVKGDPAFSDQPAPPAVVVTALNDYNVAVQLRVWLIDEASHITERARLREAIFDKLNAAGVEMPFETIQLAPVEVRSKTA
jgi:small conductance mechanosensitive channel